MVHEHGSPPAGLSPWLTGLVPIRVIGKIEIEERLPLRLEIQTARDPV